MMIHTQRIGRLIAIAVVLAGVSGCGAGAPRPADPAQARETLDLTLAAWKDGKSAESLRDSAPSVIVSDHQWRDGFRLVKFDVDRNDVPSGADQVFRVNLWLKDPKNKDARETAEYRVGTRPLLTVVRASF